MVSTIEIPPRAASPLLCRAAVFLRAGDLSKYSLLRLRKSNDEETYEEASLIDGHGRDLSSRWDFNIHLTHWT